MSSTTNSALPGRMGWGHVKESTPRSSFSSWQPEATILKPLEATFSGEGPVMGDEPTPARIRSTITEELSTKGERRETMGENLAIIPKVVPSKDGNGVGQGRVEHLHI